MMLRHILVLNVGHFKELVRQLNLGAPWRWLPFKAETCQSIKYQKEALCNKSFLNFTYVIRNSCMPVSQRPGGLRRRSAAARLLRLWVRNPLEVWMSVCCDCCVLSGRGLCDELITHPEESYRLWCVVVCGREASWLRRPWPTGGCRIKKKCICMGPCIVKRI
jgi:hypothetical protein